MNAVYENMMRLHRAMNTDRTKKGMASTIEQGIQNYYLGSKRDSEKSPTPLQKKRTPLKVVQPGLPNAKE